MHVTSLMASRMSGPAGRAAIALAIALSGAAACAGRDAGGPSAGAPAPVAVTTVPVARTAVAERLEAGGIVSAGETALLSARIVAPVARVHVRAGDIVRAGQVLVTFDAQDAAARAQQAAAGTAAAEQGLAEARAALAGAESGQQLAEAWHRRIAGLHERRSSTDQELDDATARRAAATSAAAAARAGVDRASWQLAAARSGARAADAVASFAELRAPFAGVVTERLTDPGNLASPGVPLLRLESAGAPRVDAQVDERRAPYLHPGDRVEVIVDAAPAAAGPGILPGTVTEIARAIAPDQRAFTVKVALPADARVRSGTFARVRFSGSTRDALLVPATAVRRQGQVSTVFVVQDATARLRLVQSGPELPEGMEVLAGLDPGERIVISPPAALADGAPVTAAVHTPADGARR